MAVILEVLVSPLRNIILVRNLKKGIGYERVASEKPRCRVCGAIKQIISWRIQGIELQKFEA